MVCRAGRIDVASQGRTRCETFFLATARAMEEIGRIQAAGVLIPTSGLSSSTIDLPRTFAGLSPLILVTCLSTAAIATTHVPRAATSAAKRARIARVPSFQTKSRFIRETVFAF